MRKYLIERAAAIRRPDEILKVLDAYGKGEPFQVVIGLRRACKICKKLNKYCDKKGLQYHYRPVELE